LNFYLEKGVSRSAEKDRTSGFLVGEDGKVWKVETLGNLNKDQRGCWSKTKHSTPSKRLSSLSRIPLTCGRRRQI
jgi:hypothetical protein